MPPTALILLVDDDQAVRDMTSELLGLAGHAVVALDSGAAALARLAGPEPFDALVTDHQMPGMTGDELIRIVRATRPDFPCLLVTGNREAANIPTDVTILSKPVRAAQLAATLAVLLAEARRGR